MIFGKFFSLRKEFQKTIDLRQFLHLHGFFFNFQATVQEPVEEIDIDLEDPEVGKAALMIQSKFRKKDGGGGGGGFFKKSKSPSPAAKKSQQPSKEKSPQIEQQPTVVKTVLVSKHVQPEPEEEIDIDLADPEVGKAALMIQSKFRKKGGSAAASGGSFFKKASIQPSKKVPVTADDVVFPENSENNKKSGTAVASADFDEGIFSNDSSSNASSANNSGVLVVDVKSIMNSTPGNNFTMN